jgi:hypothetical protein
MDNTAAFPSIGRGSLIQTMRGKGMDGDLTRCMASGPTYRTVEIGNEGNVMGRHPVDAVMLQGSPVSPIIYAISTSEHIKWDEDSVSGGKGISFVFNFELVAEGNDVKQVVRKLQACASVSIDWAERQQLELNTATTDTDFFTRRRDHNYQLHRNLTAKISVGNGFIRYNREATRWLAVWMDSYLTFKEHHNQCMKKARAAEARLRSLTGAPGVVPACVSAVQVLPVPSSIPSLD